MNVYQKRILEGRKQFLKLTMKQEKELLQIYIDMADQISHEIKLSRTNVNDKYLKELYKITQSYIGTLNIQLNKTIKANIETSSQIAATMEHAYYDSVVDDEKLKLLFNRSVINIASKTVKNLIKGNFYSDGKSLDMRIWNLTQDNAKDIDKLIKINIGRGANARKLAEQLDDYINPLRTLNAKTLEVGMNKSVSYQAQRLARTSITHSFTETTIGNAKTNPFNLGLKWNLSSSHYDRQVKKWGPDICDDYDGRVFKPDEYPLQHPNCLCYPTYENMPIENAIDELKAWAKGGQNKKLDEWYSEYEVMEA